MTSERDARFEAFLEQGKNAPDAELYAIYDSAVTNMLHIAGSDIATGRKIPEDKAKEFHEDIDLCRALWALKPQTPKNVQNQLQCLTSLASLEMNGNEPQMALISLTAAAELAKKHAKMSCSIMFLDTNKEQRALILSQYGSQIAEANPREAQPILLEARDLLENVIKIKEVEYGALGIYHDLRRALADTYYSLGQAAESLHRNVDAKKHYTDFIIYAKNNSLNTIGSESESINPHDIAMNKRVSENMESAEKKIELFQSNCQPEKEIKVPKVTKEQSREQILSNEKEQVSTLRLKS